MTLSITFYDNVKYTKEDFLNRDRDFYGDGVVNLSDFALSHSETPSFKVRIGRGVAWVDGYRISNDEDIELDLGTSSTQSRIDIIQIGHDDERSQPVLMVKQGIPATTPIEAGADHGFIKLYAIRVQSRSSALRPGDVTDRRALVPLKVTGQQIVFEGAATTGGNTYTGTQTAPQFAATGATPIMVSNQDSLPAQPVPEGSICVVDGKWYFSDGSQWTSMAPQVNTATTAQPGVLQIAAASASGQPVAAVRAASTSDVKITGTTAQTIASYTPTAAGNFVVYCFFRVITAATNVSVKLTYSNSAGAQTDMLFNQSAPVGDWRLVPAFVNAAPGTPIVLSVTAGTANQVYASATIMGV